MSKTIQNIQELNALIASSAKTESAGSSTFGNPDNGPKIIDGPITQLKLTHGIYLNTIQVTYGMSQYLRKGDVPGGNSDELNLTADQVIIGAEINSGDWINGIKFRIRDKEKGEFWSKHYGGQEGNITKIDGGGLPLRKFTYRSGDYVNELTFHFGYQLKTGRVIIQAPPLKEQLEGKKSTLSVFSGTYRNNSNVDEDQNALRDFKGINTTTSTTFDSISQFSVGYKMLAEVSVSIVKASTEWSFGFQQTFAVGTSNTRTEASHTELTQGFTAPAKHITTWKLTALEAKINEIPFTYEVIVYDPIKNVDIGKMTETGTITGTLVSRNYQFEKDSVAIKEH